MSAFESASGPITAMDRPDFGSGEQDRRHSSAGSSIAVRTRREAARFSGGQRHGRRRVRVCVRVVEESSEKFRAQNASHCRIDDRLRQPAVANGLSECHVAVAPHVEVDAGP